MHCACVSPVKTHLTCWYFVIEQEEICLWISFPPPVMIEWESWLSKRCGGVTRGSGAEGKIGRVITCSFSLCLSLCPPPSLSIVTSPLREWTHSCALLLLVHTRIWLHGAHTATFSSDCSPVRTAQIKEEAWLGHWWDRTLRFWTVHACAVFLL